MSCEPSHIFMPRTFHDDSSSDYGSDFTPEEEEQLNDLLAQAATEHATPRHPIDPQAFPQPVALTVGDIEDYGTLPPARTTRILGKENISDPWPPKAWQVGDSSQTSELDGTALELTLELAKRLVEHPDSTEGREVERERSRARELESTPDVSNTETDTRSPIKRFRKPPKKAFSVTDLVSPAWCELQYWYTLTKHGRKRRTPAMKAGSTIHKTLEDEVHTTVSVEITTKEDAWALRIWNIIQGLRSLREYGITRELEVWGLVDGELVNGVIDELSYVCPDSGFEATAADFYANAETSTAAMPEYQMSLEDYFSSGGGKKLSDMDWGQQERPTEQSSDQPQEIFSLPRIYITDVKSRGSKPVPTVKSSSFRPTSHQLQLYYHMLNGLITSDDVSIELLASRYDLDLERPFTDAFLSEVGGLNDHFFDALSSQEFDSEHVPIPDDTRRPHESDAPPELTTPFASQDSTTVLMEHNNLKSLWTLMKEQLRFTFLPPEFSQVAPSIPSESQPKSLQPYPTLVSPLLTARFVAATPLTETDSQTLGSRSFLFDPRALASYLSEQMEWWRGKRDPRGVEIMEAWKCRLCDFRDECTWRQEREWDLANRNRAKRSPFSAG